MKKFLLFGLLGLPMLCPKAQAQEGAPIPNPELSSLVPVLIDVLKDADMTVRANAEEALANLGLLAMPKVKGLLEGSDPKLRIAAARILGKMAAKGHRFADMVPALTKCLKDQDVELRREASAALVQVVAGPLSASSDKLRLAKVVNPTDVYDVIHRNKGKDTLDWPSADIQRQAGADAWGDWRPVRGDIGQVIAVCSHPFEPTTRVFILRIGKYYVPMAEKGIELLP